MRSCLTAALLSVAPLTSAAAALPPLLEAAVVATEAVVPPEGARFSFRQTVVNGDAFRAVFSYDPTAPTPWTLVEPADAAARDDTHAAALSRRNDAEAAAVTSGNELADRRVFFDTPRKTVGETSTLLREDDETATFTAAIPNVALPDGAGEVLRAEITVAKDQPRFLHYRVYITEGFKPSIVARVESFELKILYARLGEDGPFYVTETAQRVRGNAMFRNFDQATTVTVTDLALSSAG